MIIIIIIYKAPYNWNILPLRGAYNTINKLDKDR